jgi:thiamine biosynthesis lipoprotein
MMPSSKLNNKQKPKSSTNRLARVFEFEAIGTVWHIHIEDRLSEASYSSLCRQIKDRIEIFDHNYSRFRSDSLVTFMSKNAGFYTLPEDAELLLDLYEKLYKITNGQMTLLIGQMVSDAGYDPNYSLQPKPLRSTPKWEQAIDYKFPNLTVKTPVMLDFGAAGKGYLVDIIADLLKSQGLHSFSINAGGDIVNHNVSPSLAQVGLEHPTHSDEVIGVAKLTSGSICASAGNRRKWGAFHHIINPNTKQSPDHILSTWVVADSALLADGIATALYFADARQLQKHFSFEYALIRKDLQLESSSGFPGTFFVEQRKASEL